MIGWLRTKKSDQKEKKSASYLVVPDLHGQYSLYTKVEEQIKSSDPQRTILFLGDYMDRGEPGELLGRHFEDAGSLKTLRALIDLKSWAKEHQRTMIFLRGNHERFYESYYFQKDKTPYEKYPFFRKSVEALDAYFKEHPDFYSRFEAFLADLKPYHLDTANRYLFVHAGIDPDISELSKQEEEEHIYWIRDKFLFSEKRLEYTVVFGHTPFETPFVRSDKIGLDSGVYTRPFINLLYIDGQNSKILTLKRP